MTRRIAFEGIENFRDFGDYAAGDRRLRRGLLYRSAHHAKASDADLDALAGLGLSVIVDLRRTNERDRDPCRRWDGFGAQVIENDIGHEAADEWHTFLAGSDLSEASFRNYMLALYDAAPTCLRPRFGRLKDAEFVQRSGIGPRQAEVFGLTRVGPYLRRIRRS